MPSVRSAFQRMGQALGLRRRRRNQEENEAIPASECFMVTKILRARVKVTLLGTSWAGEAVIWTDTEPACYIELPPYLNNKVVLPISRLVAASVRVERNTLFLRNFPSGFYEIEFGNERGPMEWGDLCQSVLNRDVSPISPVQNPGIAFGPSGDTSHSQHYEASSDEVSTSVQSPPNNFYSPFFTDLLTKCQNVMKSLLEPVSNSSTTATIGTTLFIGVWQFRFFLWSLIVDSAYYGKDCSMSLIQSLGEASPDTHLRRVISPLFEFLKHNWIIAVPLLVVQVVSGISLLKGSRNRSLRRLVVDFSHVLCTWCSLSAISDAYYVDLLQGRPYLFLMRAWVASFFLSLTLTHFFLNSRDITETLCHFGSFFFVTSIGADVWSQTGPLWIRGLKCVAFGLSFATGCFEKKWLWFEICNAVWYFEARIADFVKKSLTPLAKAGEELLISILRVILHPLRGMFVTRSIISLYFVWSTVLLQKKDLYTSSALSTVLWAGIVLVRWIVLFTLLLENVSNATPLYRSIYEVFVSLAWPFVQLCKYLAQKLVDLIDYLLHLLRNTVRAIVGAVQKTVQRTALLMKLAASSTAALIRNNSLAQEVAGFGVKCIRHGINFARMVSKALLGILERMLKAVAAVVQFVWKKIVSILKFMLELLFEPFRLLFKYIGRAFDALWRRRGAIKEGLLLVLRYAWKWTMEPFVRYCIAPLINGRWKQAGVALSFLNGAVFLHSLGLATGMKISTPDSGFDMFDVVGYMLGSWTCFLVMIAVASNIGNQSISIASSVLTFVELGFFTTVVRLLEAQIRLSRTLWHLFERCILLALTPVVWIWESIVRFWRLSKRLLMPIWNSPQIPFYASFTCMAFLVAVQVELIQLPSWSVPIWFLVQFAQDTASGMLESATKVMHDIFVWGEGSFVWSSAALSKALTKADVTCSPLVGYFVWSFVSICTFFPSVRIKVLVHLICFTLSSTYFNLSTLIGTRASVVIRVVWFFGWFSLQFFYNAYFQDRLLRRSNDQLKQLRTRAPRKAEKSEVPDSYNDSCTICLEDFAVGESAYVLPCKHTFHSACASEWLAKSNRCPNCREAVQGIDLVLEILF